MKYLSLVLLLIIFSCHHTVERNIEKGFPIKYSPSFHGIWELESNKSNDNRIEDVEDDCEYKEQLILTKPSKLETFDFNNFRFEGYQIGRSEEFICTFDPINYQPEITKSSCPSIWIMDKDNPQYWVEVSETLTIQYEANFFQNQILLNVKKVILSYEDSNPNLIFTKKE